MQFRISSIALGIDRSVVARGPPGGKTSGAPNLFNEVKIHLLKKLLGLCDALLPTHMEEAIPLALTRTEVATRGAGQIKSKGTLRWLTLPHPISKLPVSCQEAL